MKNFNDATSRDDKQEWAEAYNKEYQGFKEQNTSMAVCPDKGIRIHNTLTRLEYKEDNGTFLKRGESFRCSNPLTFMPPL
jgi:hypothetical protein